LGFPLTLALSPWERGWIERGAGFPLTLALSPWERGWIEREAGFFLPMGEGMTCSQNKKLPFGSFLIIVCKRTN